MVSPKNYTRKVCLLLGVVLSLSSLVCWQVFCERTRAAEAASFQSAQLPNPQSEIRDALTKAATAKTAAATITVSAGEVAIAANGKCSLREAIINANNDAATHADCAAGNGVDTIVLAANSTYTINDIDNATNNANGLPSVTSGIIIEGNNSIIERDSSAANFRLLHIAATGNLTVKNATLQNGSGAQGFDGGMAYNLGAMTLESCTVTNNIAGSTGAILNNGSAGCNHSLTVTNCTFSNNRATVTDVGAIYQHNALLTITNSSFTGHSAVNAGAIFCDSDSPCIISGSTFSGNSATATNTGGGAIRFGGGGTKTIINSTINGNSTNFDGGGIVVQSGTVNMTNSTISGNTAKVNGGGISVSGGTVNLNFVTIANNTADSDGNATGDGGGVRKAAGGTINLKNSIVADNSDRGGQANDISGTITSQGYNHIENTTGGTFASTTGDVTGSDPGLMALTSNGGATQTHALTNASAPRDTIPNGTNGCGSPISGDQRGYGSRPINGTCDKGAFEFDALPGTAPTITGASSIVANTDPGQCSASLNFNATVTGSPAPIVTCRVCATEITWPHSFATGTTTVTCTATNGVSPDATYTFAVMVVDNQPPTITCPANISGPPPGVVTYTTPTAMDNCSGTTVSCVPPSGSNFVAGTTTVTCTATDAANQTGSCSFTVTTVIPCTITCPANQAAWTSTNSALVTYPAPTTDGGGCGTVTCTPASGSSFNVGTTTVTCSTIAGPSCSFTVTVNRLTLGATLDDPLACAGPGDKVNGSFSATNTSGASATVSLTATLSNLVTLPGTATATQPGAVTVTANSVNWTGTLGAGQSVTVSWMGQLADNLAPGTQACSVTTATVNSLPVAGSAQACVTVNCPSVGPGTIFPATSEASDQKAGSVLIYNVYTSGATSGNTQNTRINITNTHLMLPAYVHLFFVAEGCAIADSYICLTGNQTASFLASDLDPGTTGYLVAVAVNQIGCPTSHNFLIGDEYVKFTSGHAANLGAIAFSQLAGGLPACNGNTVTATLNFDGVSYNRTPATLALDNVGSRADGNDTLLILNRIGGNLGLGASTLSTVFGILYDDAENSLSFSVSGSCQLRSSISNNFPRTTPRFETFIPAGRSGWLKLYNQTGAIGITGAAINFNANAASSAGAFNQGHNLHHLTLNASSSYVIPVFPPSC